MNILIINHYAGSPEMGMEFRPYYFAREWIKMGHRVDIIAADYSHLRRNNPEVERDFQEEVVDGIHYHWIKTGRYEGNGAQRAVTMFQFVSKLWKNVGKINSELAPDVVIFDEMGDGDEVQAVAEDAADFENGLSFSEQELSAMEDRLALIARLMKQHGVTDEQALLDKLADMQTELAGIQSSDEYLAQLERRSDVARDATIAASQTLTAARKQAAVRFEQDVCRQLTFMDMPHVKLAVSLEPTALTGMGGDRVEFLIASNPGEPPKSIAKTASGGELSRIMLALKSVLAQVDDIDTMVFDEVDSGISGHAAGRVGTLMRSIADNRQALGVTHLAQIAACGHSHLLVQKSVSDGRTYTVVTDLAEADRLQELARIMGGAVTDATLSAARELYAAAQS